MIKSTHLNDNFSYRLMPIALISIPTWPTATMKIDVNIVDMEMKRGQWAGLGVTQISAITGHKKLLIPKIVNP